MRTLSLTGTLHPQAEVQAIRPGDGVVIFAWLSAGGARVDSGRSQARFTPVEPDEAGEYPAISDATLIAAIEAA